MKNFIKFFNLTILIIGGFFVLTGPVLAAYGDTATYVGKIYDGDGGQAANAYLDFCEDIDVDSNGNFYVADTDNNVIREIKTDGKIETIAGTGAYGDVTGGKSQAEFALPRGVAVDSEGNVYVADTDNNKIKKIETSGETIDLVTSGLEAPEGVEVFGTTLYIVDTGNSALKKISTDGGKVTTVTTALKNPKKAAVSLDGSAIFVADSGHYQVVKINALSGAKSLIAGSGEKGYQEGIGEEAQFNNLWGIAVDGEDTLYVSDGDGYSDFVRKITISTQETEMFADDSAMISVNYPAGLVVDGDDVLVANSGLGNIYKFSRANSADNELFAGLERFGNKNGAQKDALFGRPYDLVMTKDRQYIYVADNNKIRRISRSTGEVSHVIGHSVDNYREGTDEDPAARFSTIQGITVNSSGTALYVADRWNNRVRKIDLTQDPPKSSLVTGAGSINNTGEDDNGYQEGGKCANEFDGEKSGCAYLNHPAGIVISQDNEYLYFTDTGNNKIRKVRVATGVTSLVAGGKEGYRDGVGSYAQFSKPFGITIDEKGENLYIADTDNNVIREVNIATSRVTTISGTGESGYVDAVGTQAAFSVPEYVKWGGDNNLYVTEVGSAHIRLIDLNTRVTKLVAGSGERGFFNGARDQAKFNILKGMVVDNTSHTLLVADSWNDLVRSIDIAGEAPYTESAPTVSAISPNRKEIASDPTHTKMVEVFGTNFRHGALAYFGSHQANAVYVQSATSLAVELPFGLMSGGYYSVMVYNTDGQSGILEKGFEVTVNGQTPSVYHTLSGAIEFTGDKPPVPGKNIIVYPEDVRGGYFVTSVDANGDGRDEIIAGTDVGLAPQITIYDDEGVLQAQFFAYSSSSRTGVRLALGDVDGNGHEEIITVPGPGAAPLARVFNVDGTVYHNGFSALDGKFLGGAFVAAGDVNKDGKDEIIVTAGAGGGPHVTIHNRDGTVIGNFMAYDQNFRAGIVPATVDFDNDGRSEIITGPNQGAPHVQMFSVQENKVIRLNPGFFAFSPSYRRGISVAGGDVDGDAEDEIIVGVGDQAEPIIKIYNKTGDTVLYELLVYVQTFQGGVNVGAGDVDRDGKDELLVIPRSGGGPQVRIIDVE